MIEVGVYNYLICSACQYSTKSWPAFCKHKETKRHFHKLAKFCSILTPLLQLEASLKYRKLAKHIIRTNNRRRLNRIDNCEFMQVLFGDTNL
jgi:hypothetical protein